MKLRFGILSFALLVCLAASAEGDYGIEKKWNLDGAGGWGALLVDAPSHRLYVPRTNRIAILDTANGQPTGEIRGVIDARAIALDDSGRFGYITDISDGKAGFLRVFDQTTLRVIASIPTGLFPDAVVFDSGTHTVVVFSRHDRNALLVDAQTNKPTATVQLPGRPSNAAVDGRGIVFVSIEDQGQIARIDLRSGRSTAAWMLTHCQGPTGLAIDTTDKRLFTLCENGGIAVIHADSGARITSIATGVGPGTISFDSHRKLIFIANGNGQLTLIQQKSANQYAIKQTLNVMPGSHVLAVDHAKDKAYLIAAEYGQRFDDVSEELRLRPTPASGKCSVVVVGRKEAIAGGNPSSYTTSQLNFGAGRLR